ncbi:MAG: asparagine synthase (glutamine-hydrolyzing), partial [Polyangiales bacterium]
MCGIAGALTVGNNPPVRLTTLEHMASALRHRGPDEFGIYRDERVGLAHARLSIIDLETGQQPMSNEDGTVWLVFNGEIFNYGELRRELLSHGHVFRTRSDTETIVHAYEQWGDNAFAWFNGQFAIALWDVRKQRLVLARDALGVRPLFTCAHGGRVWFASEIKAIFAGNPDIPRALDPVGLDQTFTFWSTVAPQTVFAGVEELPPGHVRVYEDHDQHERPFTSPHFPQSPAEVFDGSDEDAATEVYDTLREATRRRMVLSDVPVGCYLSGGLDSSLVATLARGVCGKRLRTFSLRFDDGEYDETSHQRTMVDFLGSDHQEILVTKRDIAEAFPEVVAHAERPLLRSAPAPMLLLSQLVRRHGVKVVLTGEGADEMFAGYDLFREAKVRRFWARDPASTLRPRLLERLYPYLARSPVAQQELARTFSGRNLGASHDPG